jgi:hypothetical protein
MKIIKHKYFNYFFTKNLITNKVKLVNINSFERRFLYNIYSSHYLKKEKLKKNIKLYYLKKKQIMTKKFFDFLEQYF